MSAASVENATEYVRRMIGREMRGPCDLEPAMHRLESRFGIPFHTMNHLRRGRAKTVEAGLFARLHGAYLAHCERQLRQLAHELETEKVKGNDLDADLVAETEALLAKIQKRRGIENGR